MGPIKGTITEYPSTPKVERYFIEVEFAETIQGRLQTTFGHYIVRLPDGRRIAIAAEHIITGEGIKL